MFFLEQLEYPSQPLQGIVMSESKIWVPGWRRLIWAPNTKTPGDRVTFKYHLNMNAASWKRRMVVEVL